MIRLNQHQVVISEGSRAKEGCWIIHGKYLLSHAALASIFPKDLALRLKTTLQKANRTFMI
jgi:hypothetical protein